MRILITGATGLVGERLVQLCHEKGINVNYLTTQKRKIENREEYKGFYYDPSAGEIDKKCFERVGTIINLAGENISSRWTKKQKEKIINSRLDVINLLFQTLQDIDHEVGHFISASGISIYPSSLQKMYYEDEKETANTFLGTLVQKWEAAADKFSDILIRVAKIRTGLVLSEKGGALPKLEKPFKYNLGAALGSGKQWQSWIHIDDLARIYLFAVENGLQGVYNAVAPNPVTNEKMMEELAKKHKKNLWLPNVPAPFMKLALGEMASTALESQLVSDKKIREKGFSFNYPNLGNALQDLKE